MANVTNLTEARKTIDRYRNRFQNMKQESEAIAGRGAQSLTIAGGAATCGALRGFNDGVSPKIPGTEIDIDLLAGTGIGIVGIVGGAGKWSELAVGYGMGLVAPTIAEKTEEAIRSARD